MEFRELTEAEFTGVEFGCRSFLQSGEMYRRYKALGWEAYLVGVVKGDSENVVKNTETGVEEATEAEKVETKGEIVAAGLILAQKWRLGKKIMRVAGGWLMDYEKDVEREHILRFLTREAKKFCRKRGGMMIEISPNVVVGLGEEAAKNGETKVESSGEEAARGEGAKVELSGKKMARGEEIKVELEKIGYKYLGEYRQAKWIYVLELTGKTFDGLMMEFRTTHRQLIRKAEREGVRVRELGVDEMGIWEKVLAETGARHGFRGPEKAYFASMKENFGEKVKFVVAEKEIEGENESYTPLAVAMFVDDGEEVVYLYSGSVRRLQKYNGAYAIQGWAIRWALAEGKARYNFYGTRPVEGDGVYAFKQGFRGHVEELLGGVAIGVGWLGGLYVKRLKTRKFGKVV